MLRQDRERLKISHGVAQLIQVAVFLAAAGDRRAARPTLRMGAVLGYLAAGIVIGPYVLGPLYALNESARCCSSASSAW